MTTSERRTPEPVDLDLLADYGCGILAGTPDADRIATLIETDADWAEAHRALTDAEPLVLAGLADLGAEPAPMPADVLAGILAALPTANDAPAEQPAAPVDQLAVARRRRQRVAGWSFAAAAAVVLVALAGVLGIGHLVGRDDSGSSGGDNRAANAPSPTTGAMAPNQEPGSNGAGAATPHAAPLRALPLTATGHNYTARTLHTVATADAAPTLDSAARGRVPVELTRLTAPAALDGCLHALAQEHPGTPQLADYALFDGRPALIVVVRTGSHTTTVVAGPACGTDGADIRYQTAQ